MVASSPPKVRHILTNTPPVEDWRRDEQTALRTPRGPAATGSARKVRARLLCGLEAPVTQRPRSKAGAFLQSNRSSAHFHEVRVPHSGMTDSYSNSESRISNSESRISNSESQSQIRNLNAMRRATKRPGPARAPSRRMRGPSSPPPPRRGESDNPLTLRGEGPAGPGRVSTFRLGASPPSPRPRRGRRGSGSAGRRRRPPGARE